MRGGNLPRCFTETPQGLHCPLPVSAASPVQTAADWKGRGRVDRPGSEPAEHNLASWTLQEKSCLPAALYWSFPDPRTIPRCSVWSGSWASQSGGKTLVSAVGPCAALGKLSRGRARGRPQNHSSSVLRVPWSFGLHCLPVSSVLGFLHRKRDR